MSPRASFWIRATAWAAPAALFASARTDGLDERAPCPPVESRVDVAVFERRDAPLQWSIGDPTAEEQLLLELMNRARVHPADEGDRIFVDYGNQRVTQATNFFISQRPGVEFTRAENRDAFHGYAAKPALAFNGRLIASARGHSALLKQYDQQSHQISDGNGDPLLGPGGVPVEPDLRGRVVAAGYAGTFLGESVFSFADDMVHAHAGFAVDFGQPVPTGGTRPYLGHRLNLMGFDDDPARDYREVGVGVIEDASAATRVGPRIVTIDFAISAADPTVFVTGVAYDDLNGNGFYDKGEGLAGVRVDLDVGGTFAITSASGGYAVPVFGAPGTVHVTASGATIVGTQTVAVDVTTANVKVDFTRAPDPPLPPWIEVESTPSLAVNEAAPTTDSVVLAAPDGFSDTIGDIEVEVHVDHPARQDLDVRLVSPLGGQRRLFDHGPSGESLHGTFGSELDAGQSLWMVVGAPYVGTWTLRVEDTVAGNDGVLVSWKLRVRPQWARPLFVPRSPLFVTRLAFVDSKKPAADSVSFAAVVDAGRTSLGTPRAPRLVVRPDGGLPPLVSLELPEKSVKRALKGTSKFTVSATVRKLDLPAIAGSGRLVVELVLDDAFASEKVVLTNRAFNGSPTSITYKTFHIDSLATRVVAKSPTYTVKGRFADQYGGRVGTGTLDVFFGSLHVRDAMAKATTRGKVTTYKSKTGAVRSLVVDAGKGTFRLVVASQDDPRAMDGTLEVALRLGDDGFFGRAAIVPAGSLSSLKY